MIITQNLRNQRPSYKLRVKLEFYAYFDLGRIYISQVEKKQSTYENENILRPWLKNLRFWLYLQFAGKTYKGYD